MGGDGVDVVDEHGESELVQLEIHAVWAQGHDLRRENDRGKGFYDGFGRHGCFGYTGVDVYI